jgi:hypothetical protein
MAPQTRKSQASTSAAEIHASSTTTADHLVLTLPDDFEPSILDALTGSTTAGRDWSAPNAETVVALYRLVISQKAQFDTALQEWEERLAQKDADLEQALQDSETYRRESNESIEALKGEVEVLKSTGTMVEEERTRLVGVLASLQASEGESTMEVEVLKGVVQEREREKKTLTDALDAALNRETRLHGVYTPSIFTILQANQNYSLQPKLPPSTRNSPPFAQAHQPSNPN